MPSVEIQERKFLRMKNSFANFKKLGAALMTKGACLTRFEQLRVLWVEFERDHEELEVDMTEPYFKEDKFSQAYEAYLVSSGLYQDYLLRLDTEDAHRAVTPGMQDALATMEINRAKLPQIELEQFDGEHAKWTQFRDTFKEMVVARPNLPNVYKMNYLRKSLTGDAAELIADIPASGDNFSEAWKAVLSHYDNKRLLVNKLVAKLMTLEAMASDTASELNHVHNHVKNVLQALKALGCPVDKWDHITVFLVNSKLTWKLQAKWEDSLSQSDSPTEPASFADMLKFLEAERNALTLLESTRAYVKQGKKDVTARNDKTRQAKDKKLATHVQSKGKGNECACCGGAHFVTQCETFQSMSPSERKQIALQKHLCFRCLGKHPQANCKTTKSCFVCRRHHHTYLHVEEESKTAKVTESKQESTSNKLESIKPPCANNILTTILSVKGTRHEPLLATARVAVCAADGQVLTARALVDQCAQSSFITEGLCQRLKLHKLRVHLPITGIGKRELLCQAEVEITIRPHFASTFSCTFKAYVLPCITAYEPAFVSHVNLDYVKEIKLADPAYDQPGKIDILLGTEVHSFIVREGLRRGPPHMPIATNTALGWILSGAVPAGDANSTISRVHCQSNDSLEQTLRKFWEIEEPPKLFVCSKESIACEEHYAKHTRRLNNGTYQVRLPFRGEIPDDWGNSFHIAKNCLIALERRFAKRPELGLEYAAALQSMIDAKQIVKIEINSSNLSRHYFLPHHAVIKESSNTTRLRPVFNASARNSDGRSLNDLLWIGPNLLPDLVPTLARWRCYKYAFVADVSKMYLQIALHPEDWRHQTILWRDEQGQEIEAFALTTVTFGCRSSSFLASRTLRQLALDEGNNYPLAVPIVREEMYMDDVLSGAEEIESAIKKCSQLSMLMSRGNFKLAKWMSNDKRLLVDIPPGSIAAESTLKVGLGFSVLGLVWEPSGDVFRYNVDLKSIETPVTRRKVLSSIAGMFDPSGWIAPVIIRLKVFMQTLWIVVKGWDDPLPVESNNEWVQLHEDLLMLEQVHVPRLIDVRSGSTVELHGFADASKFAYAAVLYVRVITQDASHMKLLGAKTKVTPLKTLSIPRLELCAAHLLAKLVACFRDISLFARAKIHLWSDSKNTLDWIHGRPSKWPTFLANRCGAIARLVPEARWHHVRTALNPADVASRGCNVSELIAHALWWSGPAFLTDSVAMWPDSTDMVSPNESIQPSDAAFVVTALDVTLDKSFPLLDNFSTLSRSLRITVLVIRFIKKVTLKIIKKLSPLMQNVPPPCEQTSLLELNHALLLLCRITQSQYYAAEIAILEEKRVLSKKNSLFPLSPIYQDDFLRVGGRLRHSLLDEDEKFPIILPPNARITDLIVDHFHRLTLHGGNQAVMTHVRRRFWIPKLRQRVKAHISRCVTCLRFSANTLSQKMADLPPARVRISRPFARTGLDYAGPYSLRTCKTRGYKTYKGYIVVFVCMATKAAHLEVVSSYDTASFLSAFRRFVSRRGPCAEIYSDQGTNFVGANSELRRMFGQHSEFYNKTNHALSHSYGTAWKFNPPGAPHFGGLWEACVRAVKFHLKRIIGETILTFEEFATLLAQIEAQLNSRPLIPLSDDSSESLALTPAHFLIGEPSLLLAEPCIVEKKIAPLDRWRHVTQLMQSFWQKWSREYLQTLQKRHKWNSEQPNIAEGDVVLIKSENFPPAQWPLARVVKVHVGSDGLVRVATLKTLKSTLQRPIVKLIKLPGDCP